MNIDRKLILLLVLILISGCGPEQSKNTPINAEIDEVNKNTELPQGFSGELSNAAINIIDPTIKYVPDYVNIPYPNGDVNPTEGVCTDVVIRAYRKLGIDLQRLVHEDMSKNFHLYPKKWGLKTTDRNIDHRRVPNLMTFFERKGEVLPITKNKNDFKPGDIVTWDLNNGMTHIGIVIHHKSKNGVPLTVHNIGGGQVAENVLFSYKMTGHYRYPKSKD